MRMCVNFGFSHVNAGEVKGRSLLSGGMRDLNES